jgi:hypothetical protein
MRRWALLAVAAIVVPTVNSMPAEAATKARAVAVLRDGRSFVLTPTQLTYRESALKIVQAKVTCIKASRISYIPSAEFGAVYAQAVAGAKRYYVAVAGLGPASTSNVYAVHQAAVTRKSGSHPCGVGGIPSGVGPNLATGTIVLG